MRLSALADRTHHRPGNVTRYEAPAEPPDILAYTRAPLFWLRLRRARSDAGYGVALGFGDGADSGDELGCGAGI
jgi:hypothetical protein